MFGRVVERAACLSVQTARSGAESLHHQHLFRANEASGPNWPNAPAPPGAPSPSTCALPARSGTRRSPTWLLLASAAAALAPILAVGAAAAVWRAPLPPPLAAAGALVSVLCGALALAVAAAAREMRSAGGAAWFRDVADSAPVMIWATDAFGENVYLNRSWYEFSGQTPGMGVGWLDAVHPEDLEAAEGAFEAASARRVPFRKEYRVRRADGAWRWVIDAASPRSGARGEFLGYVGSILDITERRAAEQALAAAGREARDEKARFQALAEAMPQLVWSTLPDGWCDYLNRRWYDHTGQAPGAAEGHGWAEALHPDDRARVAELWRRALEAGEVFATEHRLRGADGGYRWFLARGMPLREPGSAGRVLRWLGTCTDISEIVAAREERARQSAELERLVAERTAALRDSEARLAQAAKMEALGRLAGGVAHDFNNVLQAVKGGVSLAASRIRRDPDGALRYLDLAANATERGAAVTGRLLSFARRGELSVAPLEPAPMLDGLAQMLRHTLGPSVTLDAAAEPGCPALLADAGQLEAVLVNLANNAKDALPGGTGRIVLSAARCQRAPRHLPAGDYVRLSVSDDGEGMAPDVLAKVSEPFFTTKPKGKGTGLGLAMACGFAEQSGGALAIESAPGQGTTVSLWLPRATGAARGPDPRRARDDEDQQSAAAGPGASLLVVDDEAGVRAVLCAALAERGHAVAEAGSAAPALARFDAGGGRPVDALVTDLVMPGGMDGLALIREARRRRPGLPAVLITGHVGDAVRGTLEEAAVTGPFAVLRKPVSPEALEAQVAALLRGRAGPSGGVGARR